MVAFSNAEGGNVLVGVSDGGHVVGRTSATGLTVEDAIRNVMTTVRDPGRYHIYEVDVDGKPVTVLAIEPRRAGFAQTSDGRVLYRRGKRNVPLYGAELAEFVSRRLQQPFEATASRVPLSSADSVRVQQVADAFGWSGDQTLIADRLAEVGLATHDPEPVLTIAGSFALVPS